MTNQPFPSDATWRYEAVTPAAELRIIELERAAGPEELVASLRDAFLRADASGVTRYGWEPNDLRRLHCRAIVQFPVAPILFDWFFNARSGYRAQFRVHPQCGLDFNAAIIGALR